MKKRSLVCCAMILFVAVCFAGTKKSSAFSFYSMFPKNQQKSMGLQKLTKSEKIELCKRVKQLMLNSYNTGLQSTSNTSSTSTSTNNIAKNVNTITPTVPCKYDTLNDFIPLYGGDALSPSWEKAKVIAIVQCKYDSVNGFIPLHGGDALSPSWKKDEVLPVVPCKYDSLNDFIPLHGGDALSPSWKKKE